MLKLTNDLSLLKKILIFSIIYIVGILSLEGYYKPDTFKVMTYNIRFDGNTAEQNSWDSRKDYVINFIKQGDIVGIQEGLIHQIHDIDSALSNKSWFGVSRDGGVETGEFSAVFYNTSRFELLDKGTFWLSGTPDSVASIGWDAMFPRICTWGKLYDKKLKKNIFIFNTHFDHVSETARLKSAELIKQKIYEIAGAAPSVLIGDFNFLPDSKPYLKIVESDFNDAKEISESKAVGPVSTYNGFKRELVKNKRIDYVFVNKGFKVNTYSVLDDKIADTNEFPSDHCPVFVELEFNN